MNVRIGRRRLSASSYSSSTTSFPEGASEPPVPPTITTRASQLATASRQAFREDTGRLSKSSARIGSPPAATIPFGAALRYSWKPRITELTKTRARTRRLPSIIQTDAGTPAVRTPRPRSRDLIALDILATVDLDPFLVSTSLTNKCLCLHDHLHSARKCPADAAGLTSHESLV
jgi:hypothetical protein